MGRKSGEVAVLPQFFATLHNVLQPHLVEQLVVEDVSPDVSRTSAVTSFPQYLAVMRNIHFDEQVKTLSEARKIAGSQIQSVFQVCITFNM